MTKTEIPSAKTLVVLIMTSFISFTSFSQEDKKEDKDGPKQNFGFAAGANFAIIEEPGSKDVTTFYGGVIYDRKIVPFFKFRSGLTYLRNGVSFDNEQLTIDYLQIPALLKIKVGPVYGLMGFTGAVKLGSNSTSGLDVKNSDIKSYDFGSQVGLGFKILFFSIEGKYTWGKTNIANNSGPIDYHNRNFQIGMTMMLP